MILIFKSIEPMKSIGRIIYLFVYVKIENNIVSIKSDATRLEYITVKDFMLKSKPKEIQTLIEFEKKVSTMTQKEMKEYLQKEFKEMRYNLYGVFYGTANNERKSEDFRQTEKQCEQTSS